MNKLVMLSLYTIALLSDTVSPATRRKKPQVGDVVELLHHPMQENRVAIGHIMQKDKDLYLIKYEDEGAIYMIWRKWSDFFIKESK